MAALRTVTLVFLLATRVVASHASVDPWQGDLEAISSNDWNARRAAHLLERAGFGGTPDEIAALAALPPERAVARMVRFEGVPADALPPFDASGVHDPGLEPFPPSRPAATELAKTTGEAMGVKVKPTGNRRLQPVVDRFFYWLRASYLETRRLGYWWANRMLVSPRPLEEKAALFWRGHFAVHETKVRDYRKFEQQLAVFHEHGLGNFRDLLIGVSQGPAMLSFLDAGVNVKGSPNENFAREIMELFTMGVGNYSEEDIREAARAFTGWNFSDLTFVVNANDHDRGEKQVLGRKGNFSGVDVIDIILEEPATAAFVAGKIYRYFVRQDLSPELQARLGERLREGGYDISSFLTTLFLSKDFYSDASIGTQIRSPVALVVSTYRKLGLDTVPGVPDFNDVTKELGQQLCWPPTVAGWAHGRAWITPGLLIARGNFAYDVLFPDINFVPHDRLPRDTKIREVHERVSAGQDISQATVPAEEGGMMSMANAMADRDEDFNTRYGSYRGWQMAIERVKPIPRSLANPGLAGMVRAAGATTAAGAIDHLLQRFFVVEPDPELRTRLIRFLEGELGTGDLEQAKTYLDRPLREALHLILSAPDYQLG
jgi:uncharacterized protein (DUF1800 family)